MPEISDAETFVQYREAVAVVASSALDQQTWMRSLPVIVPSDEIMLSLEDSVYAQQTRLVDAGLISHEAVAAVAAILAEFESWTDVTLWQSADAMERPEWNHVRATAARALLLLDAPRPPT